MAIDWSLIGKWVGVLLILWGALLTFVVALGMVRLPHLLARMHAATKPQVLGLGLFCLGAALVLQDTRATFTLFLVFMLQLIVAPISAHMLSNAAFKNGRLAGTQFVVDELTEDIEAAEQARSAEQ